MNKAIKQLFFLLLTGSFVYTMENQLQNYWQELPKEICDEIYVRCCPEDLLALTCTCTYQRNLLINWQPIIKVLKNSAH